MIRGVVTAMAVAAGLTLAVQPAAAQGFEVGYTDIGPTVGIGGIHGASIAIGGRFERGFRQVPDLGNGVIGIMVGADYYSWSDQVPGYSWSWRYIPIGATANYHFRLQGNERLDPFVGLGLGFQIISCDFDDLGIFDPCDTSSGLYFIGRAGGRYFVNDRMAIYADVGAGAATLNAGVTFRLQ